MPDPSSMPSQDPALESFREDIMESGHTEVVDNEERGCGHLKHNSAYVRSDVQHLSAPDGEIPRFVELDQPVEYREYGERGAIIPGWHPFPGVQFGLAYTNDGGTTSPEGEIEAHHLRLKSHLHLDGDHYGEITAAHSHDILMSVGKTHWPQPEDYIKETRRRGLNLRIPAGPTKEPPVIYPMVTRCWIVHPNGVTEGRAGIIGYAVLTRTVYTTGPDADETDPDIPQYAQEWADTGKVSLATPGERVSNDRPDDQTISEYSDDEDTNGDT